jgi:MerR family transcriptional regulator, copper efflux regulator
VSESTLLIGPLVARVGMAPSALRYYEDAGLLTPIGRTAAGYRVYGPEVVARIRFIRRANALGLTLVEIRRLIESAHRELDERLLLQAAISRKIGETRSKIEELTSRRGELVRVEKQLRLEPLPDCCHLGECNCWFGEAS